jgi:hypothetical protein
MVRGATRTVGFTKRKKEMERETGLTRWAQRKARNILTKKGVLEEDKPLWALQADRKEG